MNDIDMGVSISRNDSTQIAKISWTVSYQAIEDLVNLFGRDIVAKMIGDAILDGMENDR